MRPASAREVSSASVVLHAIARHGVLHALIEGEDRRVARHRYGVRARQVRIHVHDKSGIRQPVEQIGRATGREGGGKYVSSSVVAVSLNKKTESVQMNR